MARTVLRQFTGGLSDEIDPQNLRDDQGEEALDINLKGFALEPGEGTATIDSAGHYYYRGEWIEDSKAVSFEESGIGVIKTYDEKRPEFEEIIKDDVNVFRKLGPPLPPSAVISGAIVSEGTRGERPAEGSHLLKLPETALGTLDKAVGSTPAQSLEVYEENTTNEIDDIYYYNGQAYWIVKSGSNWTVVTRGWNSELGEFTAQDVSSAAMTHNSKGSFFKGGFFVCWDDTHIDSVALSYTSMASVDVLNTVSPNDGGDAGAQGFGDNAGGNFTSGATSTGITGVDIDNNGIISFSQRITTANTLPTAYANSANERWLRMPSDPSKKGCFVVFIRDGVFHADGEASTGGGNYTEGAEPTVFTTKLGATEADRNVFPGWTSPTGKFKFIGREDNGHGVSTSSAKARMQRDLDSLGDIDFGIKYGVVFAENDSWVRVRLHDPVDKPPEMFVIPGALSSGKVGSKQAIEQITCTRTLSSVRSEPTVNHGYEQYFESKNWKNETTRHYTGVFVGGGFMFYRDTINIELIFPTLPASNNTIHWEYKAPVNNNNTSSHGQYSFVGTGGLEYARRHKKVWSARAFQWDLSATQAGTNGSNAQNSSAGTWTRYLGAKKNVQYESFGPLGDPKNSKPGWLVKNGASDGSYKNNVTIPVVPGKMNRLCSYVRGGSTTQQGAFSVSELWTNAKFASADNSLSFSEAKNKNFRIGDYIKIGQNRTNKSMHLNLRGTAKDSTAYNNVREQTFITAQIIGIVEGVKLLLAPPEIENVADKTGKYIDEDCYPVISGFIEYNAPKRITKDKPTGGPVCSLIKSDFTSSVLVGHGTGRQFGAKKFDYNKYGTRDVIEVRGSGAAQIADNQQTNYTHRISWTGADYRQGVRIPHEVRAVDQTGGAPRILYTKGTQNRFLYSQDGSSDSSPSSVPLSLGGSYYVDKDYLTHVDDKGITIYKPDLLSKQFVKANPTLSDGLGLTGNVADARTFVDSYNAVYVCVKIGDNWKLVKTSTAGPEGSLLNYDFKKPIGFDGTKIWGIDSNSTGGWDVHYATPFYESNIIGSWVFFANDYTTLYPTVSAWGQVINSRIGEVGDSGTPRYLSIDWKMDSGNWFSTGTPTIGLNHEVGKMITENTFKWYPIDIPSSLVTSGVGTVIADISGVTNTYRPLATAEVSFKSKVYRDIVFFKESETLLPTSGDTGGENKIAFVNYQDAAQSFYVLSDNAFKIVAQFGKEPELAYRLGQTDISGTAFDASKIGISTFLIGAPNMYNGFGPNIDFYYRASFVNKWGHESTPSPLPSKGISPLDSPDDCIQLNFNAPFFRLTDIDIDTIRLYRYGGDSSEFLFLSDIPMPTLPVDSDGNKYFPTISGINSITNGFSRKSAVSPYYLLKTNHDISTLKGFTNSNFLLTATPSSLDGSWRVNQVSENDSPTVAFTTTLAEDLNKTDTTVKLTNAANPSAWPSSGIIKIGSEYISYAAISSNDLTGCVRGVYDTNASDHNSGSVKTIFVTGGGTGTNYGFDDGSGGFTSSDKTATSFTNASGNIQLNATGHGIANDRAIVLKTTGVLPTGLNNTTAYYVVNSATNSLELATTLGGTPITVTGTALGSGTPSYNACVITAPRDNNFIKTWGNGATANEVKIVCAAHGLQEEDRIRLSASGTSTGVSAFTFTQSGNWEANKTFTGGTGGTTSGSGTNATFTLDTDSSGSLTGSSTDGYILIYAHGSGYAVNDTITITDPGSTSETVTVTVTSIAPIIPATKPNPSSWVTNVALSEGVDYYVKNASNADYFNISLTAGGAAMEIDNLRGGYGQGTLSFEYFADPSIQGSGFYATYGVDTSTGAITSTTVANNGSGYTVAPQTSSLLISDPGSATAGSGGTVSVTLDSGQSPNVVEWELEMEHRNQDTTTLTEALPVLTGTANVINVTDTTVFPTPSTKTFTASSDAGLLITSNAHGLEDNDLITVSSTGTLPTGLSISTNYYVKFEDANTFRLALSSGGTAIAYTNAGSPTHSMLILPKLLIGNEILAYTGKTSKTFTGVTPAIKGTIASTHGLGVLVRSYDETFATTTVTNASIEIEGFGYRDKARTPISSLYSMETDNWPPLGLEYNEGKKQFFETESGDDYFRYIKAVGSMYFGALDSDLRFSKYGTPEYWPLEAVITLDSEIRAIEEHAGEGIIFTTNSVYRVRGTDPKAMIAFRVPDARGLPAGYEHTVSNFNGGLMWLTASDGIAMYQGGRVNYLTRDKHNMGRLKAPYSCVVDGAYWLFQEPGSGGGFRLEMATGEMRLAQTSIEAYYAYFAKALGIGVVVTQDPIMSGDDSDVFVVKEIGGAKANNIKWRSKKIDAGEPAIPKALGSIAIVYEALNSTNAETIVGGIRGQALAAQLLGLDPDDLNAGDIAAAETETITDLYSIFTKYDEPNQTFVVDTGGDSLTTTERRTILMPVGFNTGALTVGDRIWNELLADNTVVESLTTTTISGVIYPSIVLDKEPLKTGGGKIYWGNLPMVEVYLNNDDTPSRVFVLPPGDIVEPLSMDLYLNDLKRFRTISVAIQGDVRVQSLSVRHYPLQRYQSQTLHHSADVFYKGDIDFRVMLDGSLVYRKQLSNAGDDFKEERIYLPSSSFGQRAHYMNESRTGMIESVNFNGSVAA